MQQQSFSIDFRIISLVLLIALGGVLVYWKPWQASGKETITITGKSVITREPDQFVFSPQYQEKDVDVKMATSKVSEIGNKTVDKLKELGVTSDQIQTNVYSYPDYMPIPMPAPETTTPPNYLATYTLTVTVKDKELAQKILDYLATTPVHGSLTPSVSFSNELRNQLETEARTKALADARIKADQTAQELRLRVGRVMSVSEDNPFVNPILMYAKEPAMAEDGSTQTVSPSLETGAQDFTFSVTVIYAIN